MFEQGPSSLREGASNGIYCGDAEFSREEPFEKPFMEKPTYVFPYIEIVYLGGGGCHGCIGHSLFSLQFVVPYVWIIPCIVMVHQKFG